MEMVGHIPLDQWQQCALNGGVYIPRPIGMVFMDSSRTCSASQAFLSPTFTGAGVPSGLKSGFAGLQTE